ncbi:hypothetical protein ZWY2020_012181 [Hordeum vulgare]|nr:hypothetical protein ZWY2020_012181 [Hordeum vulgare]
MSPSAHDHPHPNPSSYLLELAATDDLQSVADTFICKDNLSLVTASPWYGPSAKSSNRRTPHLALHLHTPRHIVAALYKSTTILSYVLSIAPSDAPASATDGATPLLLGHQGRAPSAPHAARLLLSAGASSFPLLALDHHPPHHHHKQTPHQPHQQKLLLPPRRRTPSPLGGPPRRATPRPSPRRRTSTRASSQPTTNPDEGSLPRMSSNCRIEKHSPEFLALQRRRRLQIHPTPHRIPPFLAPNPQFVARGSPDPPPLSPD